MSNVVVVGSANMDLVVTAPLLPRPGETVLGGDFVALPGGKGANQAIAVARAGGESHLVGAVGRDAFGERLRENLIAQRVGVSRLRSVDGPSGVALIAVDSHGENLIVVAPGANATLSRLDSEDLALIRAADVVMCQLETPLSAVVEAAAAGRLVVLNAAPAATLPPELLAAVDLLVVNEAEAAAVVGRDGTPDELAGDLIELVARAVITLGAAGAFYADRAGERLTVPAPHVSAVDSTGAGDAFTGALALAWAQGRPMAEAVRWACAAGAACATKRGATPPLAEEIDALFYH